MKLSTNYLETFTAFYEKDPDKFKSEFEFFGAFGGRMAEFLKALKDRAFAQARTLLEENTTALTGDTPSEVSRLYAMVNFAEAHPELIP